MNWKLLFYSILPLFAVWSAAESKAQPTTFTYQGRLTDNGVPASGLYDLRFTVYDAAASGKQQGPTLTSSGTVVSNGLFTVNLDFGSGIFTGSYRWLEIAVRTNGAAVSFTILKPRHALTASPYAIYAPTAGVATSSLTAHTARSFVGELAGEVEGPQTATRVTGVGGSSAKLVAAGAAAANAATAKNLPNTIVKRDQAGNFSIGSVTATGTLNAEGNVSVAGSIIASNGYVNPIFVGPVSYSPLEPNGTAEAYCRKAQIVSPNARQAVYDFVNGIDSLGLLAHLADFAFFCQGQNTVAGNPVSWQGEGTIVGTMNRLRGGFEFPNCEGNNHLFFTNLPPTPNGRTLIFWGAGSRDPLAVFYSRVYSAMAELSSAGKWAPATTLQYGFWMGGYGPYSYNGSVPRVWPDIYPRPGYSGNGFFCAAMACSASGQQFLFKRDYPYSLVEDTNSDAFAAEPCVIRFGSSIAPAQANGWWGLVRGFAYFDCVLSRDQILAVDKLVPRIGVIIAGDSKSHDPQLWWEYWCNAPNTWGLYSMRTNSAVSGAEVSEIDRKVYYLTNFADVKLGSSMEQRFAALPSVFPTNSQYPITLYALRCGHNDLNCTNVPGIVSNTFSAITNLWHWAKTNGWKTVGWTIDRTRVTWPATGVFPNGASNALMQLNGEIRKYSALCDYLIDNEMFYVTRYGSTPYTNWSLYPDEAHDAGGSGPLGTIALNDWASPSFGFELPPQPGALDSSLGNRLPNQLLGSGGWTANPNVSGIGFPQMTSPPSASEIGGTRGSVTNHLLRNIRGTIFDFWSDGVSVWSKQLAP